MNYKEFKERKNFAKNQVVPLLEKVGLHEKAEKILTCGHFKKVAICEECNTWHFNGAESCKDRLCPVCQKKRALLWFAKITPLLHEYLEREYFVNVLNFTIKDTDNLEEGINLLNNAFRYLTHENKTTAREFERRFIGGVKSLEVITGKNSGKWHPHFHCLVVKYIYSEDFEWLKREWENALCVVSGLYGQKLGSVYLKGFTKTSRKGLETAICECFKYMTKFNWKTNNVLELVETMQNRKTLTTWGCVRIKLNNYEADKEMNLSLTEIKTRICSTCGSDSFKLIDTIGTEFMKLADFYEPETEYEKMRNEL